MIIAPMLQSGRVKVSEGKLLGWMQDPYDPTINMPLMRNLAEAEEYDAQFPEHPLSRLRLILLQLQPSIRLAAEVKSAPPFVFREQKKPWWKAW